VPVQNLLQLVLQSALGLFPIRLFGFMMMVDSELFKAGSFLRAMLIQLTVFKELSFSCQLLLSSFSFEYQLVCFGNMFLND